MASSMVALNILLNFIGSCPTPQRSTRLLKSEHWGTMEHLEQEIEDSSGLKWAVLQALSEATFSGKDPNTKTCSKPRFVTKFKQHWYYRNPHKSFDSRPNLSNYTGSFFFVSQKNASVTNLFYVELSNLLAKYTRDIDGKSFPLKCYTDIEVTNLIDRAAGIDDFFFSDISSKDENGSDLYHLKCMKFVKKFCSLYRSTFEKSVVFDRYYCCGLVHFPENMTCDVQQVFAECGYAHSAGIPLIYRNSSKIFRSDVKKEFDKFLDGFEAGKPEERISVNTLSRASSRRDAATASVSSTRNGLDELEIDLRKYYIEDVPLVSVLAEIESANQDKIVVSRPTQSVDKNEPFRRDSSVWVINDFDVYFDKSSNKFTKGNKQYLGVYAQLLKNLNPLNILKERKPCWIAPITIPTTLSSAIINSCSIQLRKEAREGGEGLVILDPFAGSGTFLLDALVRFPKAKIIGLDRNPIGAFMARDNLTFFAKLDEVLNDSTLGDHVQLIQQSTNGFLPELGPENILTSYDPSEEILGPTTNPKATTKFAINQMHAALGLLRTDHDPRVFADSVASIAEGGGPKGLWTVLRSDEFDQLPERLFIYAMWRATYLSATSIAQQPHRLIELLTGEMQTIEAELMALRKLSKRHNQESLGHTLFSVCKGDIGNDALSNFCSLDEDGLRSLLEPLDTCAPQIFRSSEAENAKQASDMLKAFVASDQHGILYLTVEDSLAVLELLPTFADLIIGDPPYGFNTSEGGDKGMIELFERLFPILIDATKDGGEVAAAIPLQARHGRQFPYFQTNEHIESQIVRHLADSGRQARWSPAPFGTVNSSEGFDLAYWSSASALMRSVLNVKLAGGSDRVASALPTVN